MKHYKIIVILACLWACKSAPKTETNTKKDLNLRKFSAVQMKNLPIEMGKLEQVPMEVSIQANGIVDVPQDKVFMISYPVNGFVSKIEHNLLPGRLVHKGERLAVVQSLEILQLQEEYLNESTKNEFLIQENTRQKNLFNEDATAKRKWQETENNLKINQLKIKSLAEKLKLLGIQPAKLKISNISAFHSIYAQSTGYIKSVNVANGKNFMPTDVLFEIVNTDHVHVELKVFGTDADVVKINQEVQFMNDKNEAILGKVYLVDKMIDPDKKSLNIHVHIDNEIFEQNLRPGQYISGKIKSNSRIVMALKESAILSTSEGKFVFVLNNQKDNIGFRKIAIQTGNTNGGYVEILNPQDLKGEIVVKGANFIDNGTMEDD